MNEQPAWIPSAKNAGIRKWAKQLHKEAKRVFLQDKTHGQMVFLFSEEEGMISINPIPPKTDHDQVNLSIKGTVDTHGLYGAILVGEAWAYLPEKDDHTTAQLLDGEMRVSDLNDDDKTEVLFVRMENDDGDCVVYLDKIIRDGDKVSLGDSKTVTGEDTVWFG